MRATLKLPVAAPENRIQRCYSMRLVIKDTADDAAEWAANYVVARIKAYNPTEERPFVLGLPTGSSPLAAYKKVTAL